MDVNATERHAATPPPPMKGTLERWSDTALRWSTMQPIFRRYAARRLAVLAYHDLNDPARFEQQMDFLARSMRPVSLEEVQAAVAGRHALPQRAVLVTFDDGHRSVLETAMPILEARGIPAVVYVVAGLLDTEQPFWWDEARYLARHGGQVEALPDLSPGALAWKLKDIPNAAREAALEELRRTATRAAAPAPQLRRAELARLEAGGVAIGNHTLTHPCLNRCESQGRVEEEITGAHTILTDALGHAPTSFAYPNGNADARAAGVLAELGYESSFLFDHRLSTLRPPARFEISRLRVNDHTSMDRFRIIVSGLHPTVHRMRQGLLPSSTSAANTDTANTGPKPATAEAESAETENAAQQQQEQEQRGQAEKFISGKAGSDGSAGAVPEVTLNASAPARRKLKVLVLIDSLEEGGSERSLVESLPYYCKAGIHPVIVCLRRSAESLEQAVCAQKHDVRFLPRSHFSIGSSLFDSFLTRRRALRQIIASEAPDLIHTTLPRASLLGRVAAAGTGVPVLSSLVNMRYSARRLEDPNTKRWKLRAMQAIDAGTGHFLTDHFHALTHAVKEEAAAKLRIPDSKISVVERGRKTERLGTWSRARRRRAREKLGLQENDKVLLNVGRQDCQKGQKYLLEAMRMLLREHPEAVLLVAGRGGNASAEIHRMRRRHPEVLGEEAGRVRFLGHRTDVPELLAAADLFVFPSLFEGIGGAVLEAMALGLPVVASDIGPMCEVNEAGKNALLVEPTSPPALAKAIGKLLGNPERAQAFGRRSRQIFEERFTLERNARRMAELCYRVAGVPMPRGKQPSSGHSSNGHSSNGHSSNGRAPRSETQAR